jgi:hypothetical protein
LLFDHQRPLSSIILLKEGVFMDGTALTCGEGKIIARLSVDLSLAELLIKIGSAGKKHTFRDAAKSILDVARSTWVPKLTYRWFNCLRKGKSELDLNCSVSGESGRVELGYSIQFVEDAERSLVGLYTVGHELEELSKSASQRGLYLDSYIYDMISLSVLEKVNCQVNAVIESYAAARAWGVSPFLSPGSVHGWELEDQPNLLELLPISEIGVKKSFSGILHPFKSLSFLLATGPGLQAIKVGTCCQVCSRKKNCEMRQRT